MKKTILILVAVFLINNLTATAQSEKQIWTNDPPHSQLYFTVTHLGFNDISGTFDNATIKVSASKPDFSDATFELTAQTNSINTLVEARNNHLKSADFFDVEKFPTLSFKTTELKAKGKGKFKLTGDLTMHGVTKSVTLDLIYRGQTTNPMSSKLTTSFQVTGVIKRSDFSVGDKFPEVIVSDEVRIKFSGEFIQPDKQ
ncbi:YceI family protein [Mangrovimonas sp. AS39]|uniref:YceI family protein n=1 Tax=Mangrovimonas TaxID=1211036 RepID=UPI0014206206|nr:MULTISPECIES: YceI family protein [Mangrovimonas]MCF1192248.1 YceI family protein [Mangrovimonas futianensis]MCF1196003.1 YceI family protein [Mangrovimonas futianensis]NIK93279.1 YceI family protein [Mangrovimonas sp. CR14]